MAEVLYKMNQHLLHILTPLGDFIANEQSMQQYVGSKSHLPEIIASFEHLPEAIEEESKFVMTIDYQMQKIKEYYSEVV